MSELRYDCEACQGHGYHEVGGSRVVCASCAGSGIWPPPAVAAGGVTVPSVDEIEAIILATEPDIPASVDGERIWTRRMAKGLHHALTAALAVGDEGIREGVPIKYVTLGRGEWVAGTYMRDDMPSLCFGPAPEPKAPGEKPTDEVSEWATRNGAVVISFANLNAAMQMLDLVRDAVDMKAIRLPTPPSRGEGE